MSSGSKVIRPKVCAAEVHAIAQIIAAEAGLTAAEVLGDCRVASVIRGRLIAYLVVRRWTGASLPCIARVFGRDYTTVRSGARVAEHRIRIDAAYRELYTRVWRQLHGLGRGRAASLSALRQLAAIHQQREVAAANTAKAERVRREIEMSPADIPFHCVGPLTIRSGFVEMNDRFVVAMREAHGDLECALA